MEKKYDHIRSEKEARELWQEEKIYTKENNPGPIYSIDTPPPTVSGSLHIGHVFSYTQTDIIARFKRMAGYGVFYPFGFDDNGLATERFVEKKLNIESYSISRSEFIKLCLTQTAEVEKEFESLWKKIGLSVDWALSYSTIDYNSRKISQTSFIELFKKGFIYRKAEPALYCTTCRTTVAQAELDDAEKPSFFNYIIFKTDKEDLIVGTTRPELLASTSALLYHPEDTRYKHLIGSKAKVAVFDLEIPIFEDTDVDPEKGTGLVMVSTFGDKQDIIWAKKYNLPIIQSIGHDGKWTSLTGPLAGLNLYQARKKIIELLTENKLLIKQEAITHSVNVHERCKKEIEYLVFPQWFLSILPYKDKFLALAEQINWYPEFMKYRYINWVENISWDWCLSRQRFYGIPFPAWHCTNCNEIILADIKDLPIDPQEIAYPGICPNCSSDKIIPDTDVMDTWNTSSLTPYICKALAQNNTEVFEDSSFIPMNMRPQAHDIIRTWAFYTIVKSWMHSDKIPWPDIVISGHVLSSQKEKISKSKGNVSLTPENLLENYPADAVRYWTASGSLGQDIAFSENQLAIGQKLLVKLWNAFRFAQPYLEKFNPTDKTPDNLGLVNQWILTSISNSFKSYQNYFDTYEFNLALDKAEKFFWHDFCDNYLELIKDQLFNPQNYTDQEVNNTLWTLYHIGLRILQLYSPFMPHITETIYNLIYKKYIETKSIHQTRFDKYQIIFNFEDSAKYMQDILLLVSQIRKLKSENNLSLKTEITKLTISVADKNLENIFKKQERLIKAITHAQDILYRFDTTTKSNMLQDQNKSWIATIAF